MRNALYICALSFFVMSAMTIVYTFSRDIRVFASQEPLIVLPITKDEFVKNQQQQEIPEAEKAVPMKKDQTVSMVTTAEDNTSFTTKPIYQPEAQFLSQTKVQNPYAYGLSKEETQELLLIALGFFYCGVVLLTAEQLFALIRGIVLAGIVKIRQLSPFEARD